MFPVNPWFRIKAMKQNNSLIFYSNRWRCFNVLPECGEMGQTATRPASISLTNIFYFINVNVFISILHMVLYMA